MKRLQSRYQELYWTIRESCYRLTRPFRRIRHVVAWIPFLLDDYDWDHVYLYRMMAHKLDRMAKSIGHGSWGGRARRIRVAAALCRRIAAEDYMRVEPPIGPYSHGIAIYRYEEAMTKQDLELLAKYMVRYSRGWWD